VWLLSGCAGCALLAVIAVVAVGIAGVNFMKDVSNVGPVTPQTVQQSLGDVPIYPGATLDETTTRAVLTGLGVAKKVVGGADKFPFKGAGVFDTPADGDKVLAWYDKRLKASGWTAAKTSQTNQDAEQRMYQKSGETVLVQAQPRSDGGAGSAVMLMRGNLGMQPPASLPAPTKKSPPE